MRLERRRARGMSLIEVLISLVIVSIGALSATSLQIIAKRMNREASQRLEATHLANSVIERMRANNSPAALGTYVTLATPTTSLRRPLGGGNFADSVAPSCGTDANLCCPQGTSCCLPGTNCSDTQVATVELFQVEWVMDGVMEQAGGVEAGGLNAPTVCISGPAGGAAGFYTVTVAFRGSLALPEDTLVTCGHDATDAAGGGSGGTPLYGAANEFRRTLTVSAYITPTPAGT
jgi:type IV pilus assembly protein PilV